MDLVTYWNVVRRQRRIVIVGVALACALALLALVRVGSTGIGWRSPPTYIARSTLFVTQTGFPWGRSALTEYVKAVGAGSQTASIPRFAEPDRMEYLAELYSQFARSDDVRRRVKRSGPVDGRYDVQPITTGDGRILPLIQVSGMSTSPAGAVSLSIRTTNALQSYVREQQMGSGISKETRVDLPAIVRATRAETLEGLKLTAPIMLFVLCTSATLFLAFAVDNIRRSRGAVARPLPSEAPVHSVAEVAARASEPDGSAVTHAQGRWVKSRTEIHRGRAAGDG